MTNAEFAILSLVAEASRHGYEIEQVIEMRGMREWTEVGFSSIYYLLNKLEKKGLVKSRMEQAAGKGPARKVYEVTEDGRKTYFEKTLEALSVPQNNYNPLMLGLANFPAVGREAARQALAARQASLTAELAQVQERWQVQRPMPDFVAAMFDYSVTMISAEIEWLKKYREQLDRD